MYRKKTGIQNLLRINTWKSNFTRTYVWHEIEGRSNRKPRGVENHPSELSHWRFLFRRTTNRLFVLSLNCINDRGLSFVRFCTTFHPPLSFASAKNWGCMIFNWSNLFIVALQFLTFAYILQNIFWIDYRNFNKFWKYKLFYIYHHTSHLNICVTWKLGF